MSYFLRFFAARLASLDRFSGGVLAQRAATASRALWDRSASVKRTALALPPNLPKETAAEFLAMLAHPFRCGHEPFESPRFSSIRRKMLSAGIEGKVITCACIVPIGLHDLVGGRSGYWQSAEKNHFIHQAVNNALFQCHIRILQYRDILTYRYVCQGMIYPDCEPTVMGSTSTGSDDQSGFTEAEGGNG